MFESRLSTMTRRKDRGFTLLGLLFWGILLAFAAVVGMKVFPTVGEFYTIERVIKKVAVDGGSTVAEIRGAFDKAAQVEYSIVSIKGSDLDVTKDSGGKVVINFAYDKEIEIMAPVFLVIKYEGSSQ